MAQLAGAETLAQSLARLLDSDVSDVCVAQSLLPWLWRAGHLGGRGFRVLMTRLPMLALQRRLDAAASARPERTSLADFRAPDWLVEAEAEALDAAEIIITPHDEIARMFPAKALRLDWLAPAAPSGLRKAPTRSIAFPGPTIARKGAFELRDALRGLDIALLPLGSALEGDGFWKGIRLALPPQDDDWLNSVAAVVQPALVEDQPRPLLRALAAGVPVVATAACGIAPRPGLTLVPAGDPTALRQTLEELFHV